MMKTKLLQHEDKSYLQSKSDTDDSSYTSGPQMSPTPGGCLDLAISK